MGKKSRKKKSNKPNKQMVMQKIAARRKEQRRKSIQSVMAYMLKHDLRKKGTFKVYHSSDAALRRVYDRYAHEWAMGEYVMHQYMQQYGDQMNQRSQDWLTMPDGKRVFVLTADTCDWPNNVFGNFDESALEDVTGVTE